MEESPVEKIKQFNGIVEDFLKQTSPLVGSTYYFFFTKLIKVNSTMPIKCACEYLIKHKNLILTRDVNYFNEKNNYSDELGELQSSYSGYDVMGEILRLSDIYYKLDESSRENVWDILQALLLLTLEYKAIMS